MAPEPGETWSRSTARAAYAIDAWSQGYVDIDARGHLTVHPDGAGTPGIDLLSIIDTLARRELEPPFLVRFPGVLRHRLGEIERCFREAIAFEEYDGHHCLAYPVKANQNSHVIGTFLDCDTCERHGLEVGSRPELLAALSLAGQRLVLCNGPKDRDYLELVLLCQRAGQNVLPVVESVPELHSLLELASQFAARPRLGLRVKLSTPGTGHWGSSTGPSSKFGMFMPQVQRAVVVLRDRGMLDCLELLHAHLGSQIPDMATIKDAVAELARIYVQLVRLGAGLRMLDIGGGLGVDYDGTRTAGDSSMNYTLQEYASDTVWRIKTTCDEVGVPHPTIISESGRSLVAFHAALLFRVVAGTGHESLQPPDLDELSLPGESPQPLTDLLNRYRDVTRATCLEYYHDAVQALEQARYLFNLGYLDLEGRCLAEQLFWALSRKIQHHAAELERVPDDLTQLPSLLSDLYACNLSVFRSLPDCWAVQQLFPVVPLHRLLQEPTRHARLVDLTCDSDGCLGSFVGPQGPETELLLHALDSGQPYFLGAFLVGAYQEALGGAHNLLGRPAVVAAGLGADGELELEVLAGPEPARQVLQGAGHDVPTLRRQLTRLTAEAVRSGRLAPDEEALLLGIYDAALEQTTYLRQLGS
jgi:arginine decarboxylase